MYTVLDIETTGFSKVTDNILSVGFIRLSSKLEILNSGILYFWKDGWRISSGAYDVHKLSKNFLEQYKDDFNDNILRLYSLLHKGNIIGKNSTKFDMPFVQSFIKRHTPYLPDLEYNTTYDLQDKVKDKFKEYSSKRGPGTLTDYIEMYNITKDELNSIYNSLPVKDSENMHMHGALYDCVATYAVLKRYLNV